MSSLLPSSIQLDPSLWTCSCLLQALKQLQSQLTSGPHGLIVLFILPNSAEDIRREVKRWGDVTVGVPTQCVVSSKLR